MIRFQIGTHLLVVGREDPGVDDGADVEHQRPVPLARHAPHQHEPVLREERGTWGYTGVLTTDPSWGRRRGHGVHGGTDP